VSGFRYEVPVKTLDKAYTISGEVRRQLTGVSPKFLSRLRREYVECPVKNATTPFAECFTCPNFLRRVKGVVHCKGLPIG